MRNYFLRLSAIIMLSTLLFPALANAESRKIFSYTQNSVYTTAIRLLRVDLNYEILEKDQEGSFIIFNFVDTVGQKHRGSLEFLRKNDEADNLTQGVCSIPEVPAYMEATLLDKLMLKLNNDRR